MKTFITVFIPALVWMLCGQANLLGQPSRAGAEGGALVERGAILPHRVTPKQAVLSPLPAGTYTVGVGGAFPTIDSAFSRLSGEGILGAVTLLLTDTLYVGSPSRNGEFSLAGPISGAGPSSRITIRPADNVAVVIRGNGNSALGFSNVSYLTLDGISLEGNTRLKVQSELNTVNTWINSAIVLDGNCDFAVVQNLTASSGDVTARPSAGIALYSETNADPDSCLVSGTSVTSGAMGIYVGGLFPSLTNRPRGIVIRGNHIGSPADSLISRGIELDGVVGALVENNHVENLRLPLRLVSNDSQYVIGINAYFSMNTVIRNNVVHGLKGSNGAWVPAVLGSGVSTTVGQGLQIYNNMIYDIQNNSSTGSPWAEGIVLWWNADALIAYNTVYLSGTRIAPNAADALLLSRGITSCTLRNNILVNLYRSTAPDNCFALFADNTAEFTSDHNVLYVDTLWMWTALRTGQYRTLSQWQGTGYDLHSLSMVPVFHSPGLHVDTTSGINLPLDGAAIPVPSIMTDIDGQPRDPSRPDIGADEFVIISGVAGSEAGVPGTFKLNQNYPNPFNPTTIVSYQVSVVTNVKLVVSDVLGREVAVLVDEKKAPGSYEVNFNAAGLASGVYLYTLTAGNFVQTRKMVAVK